MNIFDRIYEARRPFLLRDLPPNAIYLGKSELYSLMRDMTFFNRERGVDQVMGMRLFRVDAPSHFAVCYAVPAP